MALKPFRPIRASIGGTRDGSTAAREMQQVVDQFKSWTLHMTNSSGQVLLEALRPTYEKSRTYCPVLTGALIDSGYIEVRRVGLLRGWQAEIGYGRGGQPSYAVTVHEKPVYHRPPTRHKWLQTALQEDGNEIQQRIREGFKTASGT
jgi:hypothetical protein